MPRDRYYFHITDGDHTLIDQTGTNFSNISGARDRAVRLGQLIALNVGAVVDVTNSVGASVMKAPLVITEATGPGPDALTGLQGRIALTKHLEEAIRSHNQGVVGLLFFDLDRLKDVNIAFGYPAGDAVLMHVALILATKTDGNPRSIARLESDKFAVVLRAESRRSVIGLAEALHESLREPLQYGESIVSQTLSGGLALFPEQAATAGELVGAADIALHLAKVTGSDGLAVYTNSMRCEQVCHFKVLADARAALAQKYVVPHYQPKISLTSGVICGFEALLRIDHPTLGLQLPGTIADALDHPKLSVSFGKAIQECVFDDIQKWIVEGVGFKGIAINASPVELLLSAYADDLLERLAARAIAPEFVQVEITETAMVGRGAAKIIGELQKLRAGGVAVFLDDFGCGYGSLGQLRDFPINGIKIDRSFVKEICKAEEAEAIVKVLLNLAHDLKLSLVAEGVETSEQAEYLRGKGCDVVQGFLYSKAIPAETVASFLARWDRALVLKPAGRKHEHI